MTTTDMLSHDRAVELLPWLANGSLEPAEREAVREHATNCVLCRRELEELEAFSSLAATQVAMDDASLKAPPGMHRINARIDAALERERHGARFLEAVRDWSANRWRLAFALQSAVLAALVVAWLAPTGPEAEFTTLTTPATGVLPGDGDYLRVVFEPGLDAASIAVLLDEQGLSIAAGPSERGVYTLGFTQPRDTARHDTVLENLAADDRVLFAQPVAVRKHRPQ